MTIRNGRGTCCFWLWVSNSQLDQLTWTLVVIHLGGSRDIRHGRKSVSIQFWNLSHVEMFRYSHRRDIIAKRLAWDWFITHPRIICKLLTVDSWVTCKWENIDKRSPTKEPWHEIIWKRACASYWWSRAWAWRSIFTSPSQASDCWLGTARNHIYTVGGVLGGKHIKMPDIVKIGCKPYLNSHVLISVTLTRIKSGIQTVGQLQVSHSTLQVGQGLVTKKSWGPRLDLGAGARVSCW